MFEDSFPCLAAFIEASDLFALGASVGSHSSRNVAPPVSPFRWSLDSSYRKSRRGR
jgi:hypothetical protein